MHVSSANAEYGYMYKCGYVCVSLWMAEASVDSSVHRGKWAARDKGGEQGTRDALREWMWSRLGTLWGSGGE